MSPFPPKKKQPPTGGLDAPDPIDAPKPKAAPAMATAPSPDDETGESDASGGGDYGAKLVADIEAAGKSMGLSADESRMAAGAFFKAAAGCLSGDSEEDNEANEPADDAGGMGLEGGE